MSYLLANTPSSPSVLLNQADVMSPEQAAIQAAQYSNPIEAGAKSAIRSTLGGLKGLAAGIQDAYGVDPTDMYAAAQRDAELAAAIGPKVHSLGDIHDVTDAAAYGLGQVGTMIPFLAAGGAGSLAGKGLNRALGAGLTPNMAGHAGSLAAFAPSMAGEQITQMHEVAPEMSPQERMARGLGAGSLQALAGAAVPNALMRTPAAQPFWRGLGQQVVSGGAGMAGMDVVGQLHRASYDPSYQYNPEQTMESAVAGSIGMAPFAVPHAVVGAMGDAGISAGKATGKAAKAAGNTFVDGLKGTAKAAYDAAPDAVKDRLDALGSTAQDLAAGAEALKPYMQAFGEAAGGHVKDFADNAKQAASDYTATGDMGVDRGERLINLAADLYGNTVSTAGKLDGTTRELLSEAGKDANLPEPIRNALSGKFRTDEDATAKMADILSDPSQWIAPGGKLTSQQLRAIESLRGNPRALQAAIDNIARTMDEHQAAGPRADEMRRLVDKVKSGAELSPQESHDLYATAKFMRQFGDVAGSLDSALEIGKKFKINKSEDGTGKVENLSRQRDTVNKAVREALSKAGASNRLIDRIASRIQTNDVLSGDITRLVRNAVSEGLKSYGVDPKADQTYTHLYDEVHSAVMDRVAKLKEEGVIKEVGEGDRPMSDAFREEVRDAMHTMFEGSEVGRALIDSGKAKEYADNMAQFAHELVNGEASEHKANIRRKAIEHAFGEDGAAAFDRIIAAAKREYGSGSKEAARADHLMNTGRTATQAAAEARRLMEEAHRSEKRDGNYVPASLKPYLDALENAKHFDVERGNLEQIIQEKQAQADRAEFGSNRRYELNRQIEQLESMRGRTGFSLLKEQLVKQGVVSSKNFERFIDALERYAGHEDRLGRPEKRVASHETGANHAAEKGDLNDHEVRQESANQKTADDKEDMQDFLHKRAVESRGTDSEFEARPTEFVGTSAFKEGKVKGDPGAPLSKHASGDQSDRVNINGNEFGNAVEAWHSKYGHRVTEGRGVSVPQWAEEMAASEGGKTAREHMNDALKALLAHDAERLKNENLTPEDRTFIEARARMALELGGRADAGEKFFAHSMNRSYRYYRAEQHDGSNLSYSADTLEHYYGVKGDTGYWVQRMRERDGVRKVFGNEKAVQTFPDKVYENSILTVHTPQGEMRLDFPRMVMDAMRRHQAADVEGVGEKGVKPDLMSELKNAVNSVLGALMTADGVSPDALRDAMMFSDNRVGGNKNGKRGATGDENLHFDPNLVVFRDPTGQIKQQLGEHVEMTSPKRAYTMADVTKIVGTDFLMKTIKEGPGELTEADHKAFFKPSSGKTSAKSVVADADRGVARNGATIDGKPVNVDAHAVLMRGLERAGIDPVEALGGELPETLAAAVFTEVMRELHAKGINGDFVNFAHDKFTPSALYDNVVLYHKGYANGERYPVRVRDLRKFKDGGVDSRGDTTVNLLQSDKPVPRNLRDAIAAQEQAYGKRLEANEVERKQRLANNMASERDRASSTGQERVWDLEHANSRDTEVHTTERGGKKIRYAVDRPDSALKYDASETEDFRIGENLKEHGEASYGDAPLFDRTEELGGPAGYKPAYGGDVSAEKVLPKTPEQKEAQMLKERKAQRRFIQRERSGENAAAKQRVADMESASLEKYPVETSSGKTLAEQRAKDVAEREELNTPLQQKRAEINTKVESNKVSGEATQPKPLPLWQQRLNAKIESKDVKTNRENVLAAARAQRAEEVAKAKRAVDEEARMEAAKQPGLDAYPSETGLIKDAAEGSTASAGEPAKVESAGKDLAARVAGEKSDNLSGLRAAVAEVNKLSDGELKSFLTSLPRLGESQGTVAEAIARQLSPRSGPMADWAAAQLKRAGVEFNGKQFVEADDNVGFSRQRTVDQPAAGAPSREQLQAEKQRLFADAFKLDMKDQLTDKDGNQVSGKFDEKSMTALVSSLAGDRMGTLHHEGWHGVETLLGDMGEHGQAILDSVYKAVSSMPVRRWLNERFADDADVLKQLDSAKERAAFAFQLVAAGEKIPTLAPEARTTFQKIIDWARQMAGKMGIKLTTAEERTGNFFEYVKDGGFARDFENAASLREALGEGNGDNVIRTAAKTMKPVMEAMDKVFQHTSTRIEQLGVSEYNDILHAFEGETGKGGIHLDQHRWATKFANAVGEMLHPLSKEEREKFVNQDGGAYSKWAGSVRRYLDQALSEGGVKPADKKRIVDNFYDRVDSFNYGKVNDNFEAFVTDLVRHGGDAVQGKAGAARDIANEIADKGFYYDPDNKLFPSRPDIAAKWLERDPLERANRLIDVATRIAERARRFGFKDEKLKALLEAGNAKAGEDGRKLMQDFVDVMDGKLGSDMSPGMKKLQGGLLFVQNVHALPLAVFSQMLEPMQLALRRNKMAGSLDSLFRGIRDIPRTFESVNKRVAPDYWEKLSYQVGSAPSRIVQGVMTNLMNGMHLKGKVGEWNDAFFRYNFMEQWNRSMHVEATKHAVEYLKEHARGEDKEHSDRFLKELGVTREEILSAIKTVKDNGKHYETLELSDNIERAIVQFVEEAMAHPNAGSNAMWMNDPRFALLAQMKRFTFSHSKYVLDRGMKEMKLGNAFPVAPAIIAMPWMMAADGLRDTLAMKEHAERANWGAWEYAKHAFERAGHAGRGQFATDAMNAVGRGQSPVEALGGPTVEMFGEVTRGAHNGHLLDKLFEYVPGSAAIPAF